MAHGERPELKRSPFKNFSPLAWPYLLMAALAATLMFASQIFGAAAAETLGAETVRHVQVALLARGYDPGPSDGALGSRTRGAVKSFQAASGLDPTGIVTEDVLRRLGIEPPPPPQLIRAVQLALAKRGYDPGPADGTMGRKTRQAVTSYQSDNDLPVSGRVTMWLVNHLGMDVPDVVATRRLKAELAARSQAPLRLSDTQLRSLHCWPVLSLPTSDEPCPESERSTLRDMRLFIEPGARAASPTGPTK